LKLKSAFDGGKLFSLLRLNDTAITVLQQKCLKK